MKNVFYLSILLLLNFSMSFGQEMFSPNQKLKVSLKSNSDKSYTYSVSFEGKTILEPSKLGVVRMDADFTKNLNLIAAKKVEKVVDEYETQNAKKSKIRYEARKYVYHLRNQKGQKIDFIFQVSNDGFAFRYYFPETTKDLRYINEEVTSFNFASSAVAWLQPMSDAQTGWEHCHPSYEEFYEKEIPVGTPSPIKAGWVYPALFKTKDQIFVAISEAGLDGTYCGTRLKAESPNGEYQIGFPQEPEVFTGGELNPESTLPWYSPWRVVVVGTLKTVTESTLGTDVAPKQIKMNHPEATKPGVASWSWIMLKDESINFDTTKMYIDFAAKMNWEYCLVDVNWHEKIGYEKLAELVNYGKQKNVKLIIWYNSAGAWNTTPYGPRNMLLTREGRRKEFQRVKDLGVAGLKIDFFGGDGQSMIRYYIEILEDAADIGLSINFHGATLPRGWHRTYPHLMTVEAVKGQEMVTFGQEAADEQPAHSTVLPFTRNLFDPMDFTPMTLDNLGWVKRKTTRTFELALPILFLSGIQHLAESPMGMEKQNKETIDFLSNLPSYWDDMKFIEGYPGKYVVIARKAGDKWYVSAINGQGQAQTIEADLSQLGDGYYFDDVAHNETQKREFKKGQKISLKPNGGFVAVLNAK